MKKFTGKKLLVLGSNVGSIDIIQYAKSNGAFTIVADNLPIEKSEAKRVADSNVLISTGDINTLEKYVIKEHIDGILAGISEFNLISAMTLCERLKLPFYCTKQQWNLVENKENFRKLCNSFGVSCPKTFYIGTTIPDKLYNEISYPVIIKPVDCNSSRGVFICKTKEELCKCVDKSLECSNVGRIIIEQYFEGEEFTAHYTIINGNVSLSCVDERVPVAVHSGNVTTVPIARIYPSSFINEYIYKVNDAVINLCRSLKLHTGVLFVQGLYSKNNKEFCIFEGGLRSAGEAPYRFLNKVNRINYMEQLVDYSLLGKEKAVSVNVDDNPFLNEKICCVLSFVSKGGRIAKIVGYEETVQRNTTIIASECRYHEGDETPCGDTLRQIALRFVLVCNNYEQLQNNIAEINNSVHVLDSNGNEMCYKFDAEHYMYPNI